MSHTRTLGDRIGKNMCSAGGRKGNNPCPFGEVIIGLAQLGVMCVWGPMRPWEGGENPGAIWSIWGLPDKKALRKANGKEQSMVGEGIQGQLILFEVGAGKRKETR